MDTIPWTEYSFVGYAAGILLLSLVVVILTVVYFLAVCSTCMQNFGNNRRKCRCYVLTMLICGIALVVLLILIFKDESTTNGITNLFKKQWTDRDKQERFWNTVQDKFECCGLDSPSNWGANIPKSCCKNTAECTVINAYKKGCLDVVKKYVADTLVIILGAIAFVAVGVSIIGFIFACAVNISCARR